MNLHNVAFAITNAALWLTVTGRNGRNIGDHLWVIPEGTPPEFDTANYNTWNRSYWTPARFAWQPFNFQRLFSNGYVEPLCGRRSNSTRPRLSEGYGAPCDRCNAVANQRGIIPLTYRTARQESAIHQAITAEGRAWVEAGRPQTWP